MYRQISQVQRRSDTGLNAFSTAAMIQGDKDTTIPVKHAYFMQQKAKQLQAPVEIMIIKNAGHNWRKDRSGSR